MIRLYATVIVLGILGTVLYGGYSYFKDSQETIIQLQKNITAYENAVKVTNEAIDRMREESEQMQILQEKLQKDLQEAEKYQDDLQQKLNEHNLTKLSTAKPGLIEKRVNDATTKIFKELEDITAVPTTP